MKNSGHVIALTRLACGAEAVAHGFPEQAGYDIFEGICADDIDGWDEQIFLLWTHAMDEKYGMTAFKGINPLMELYGACSKLMGSYAEVLKQASSNEQSQVL